MPRKLHSRTRWVRILRSIGRRYSRSGCATKLSQTASMCALPKPPAAKLSTAHARGPGRLPVGVRYIYQVLRGYAPEQVFAQTLLGFETVQASMDAHEPGFVASTSSCPEDGFLSMRDYTLQMKMLDYLHSVYPRVHISLHAGELAMGTGAARGAALPHSPGCRAGPRRAHRPWRGRDV